MVAPLRILSVLSFLLLIPHVSEASGALCHAVSPDGTQPRVADAEVVIAKEGKGLIPITIAPNASKEIRADAEALAGFLSRITGGRFPVEEAREPRGITVGTLQEFADPSLEKPLEIGEWNDGKEAFAIRTGNGVIRLIGASDLGTRHAVYRFLELLGVRRYFASPEWEIVPRKADLAFDAEEESRPAIPSRNIWMAFGMRKEGGYNEWVRHVRLGQSLRVSNAHLWQNVYRQHKAEFDANKESMYARVGDKLKPGKFNLANPRVRELIIETAMLPLKRADEKVEMLSIEPSDGGGWSEDEENRALGSISDRLFGVANEFAARLRAKGHPDVQVGVLAYYVHAAPPSGPVDPNVHVMLATRMHHGPYDLPRLKEVWKEKTSNFGIYEYFSTYVWGQERIRGASAYAPAADPERVARFIDEAIDLKVRAYTAESLENWALYGPGYYVAAHRMWNSNASVDSLMSDFYRNAFGPAEKSAREFYELLFPSSKRSVNYDTFRRLYEKLEEAGIRAEGNPDVIRRVDRLKQVLHANLLIYKRMRAKEEEERNRLAVEYYTYIYRTKDGNMMGYIPIFNYSLRGEKIPELKSLQPKDYPWADQPPLTHEETNTLFSADLAYLRELGEPVNPVLSSDDLVVVSLSEEPRTVTMNAVNPRLTFVAKEEGPMTIPITVRANEASKGGKEISYRIFDSKNNKVTSGFFTTPPTTSTIEIEANLPAAGVYHLRIPEIGSVTLSAQGFPAAVVDDPELEAAYLSMPNTPELFFYVPRGTKELIASVGPNRKGPLVLKDSGGIKHVGEEVFGIARIPVPVGEDGQLWTLSRGDKEVRFYNVPNIFSLDAQKALLPREVAIADGKTLVK